MADAHDADLATTCAFCFNRLRSVRKHIGQEPGIREEVERIVGAPYQGRAQVRHLLDILFNDVGLEALQERVTRPLNGLKAVTYYGCLLVRPRDITGFDDVENPVVMDQILQAVGVECLKWSYKTECCGASRPRLIIFLFCVRIMCGSALFATENQTRCRAGFLGPLRHPNRLLLDVTLDEPVLLPPLLLS